MSRRLRDFVSTYTRDLKAEDLGRLFTRDTREAYEFFAHTRFLSQFRALYQQVAAGGKVDVPEIAPGAGLLFHGLA